MYEYCTLEYVITNEYCRTSEKTPVFRTVIPSLQFETNLAVVCVFVVVCPHYVLLSHPPQFSSAVSPLDSSKRDTEERLHVFTETLIKKQTLLEQLGAE